MRSSRGERAAPRGATHAGLGLELDGRWEAEAASQPAEWRRRRQRSGVDAPAPTRPEGPGLTPALALLRRRHLRPHGPRSGKVDAPGGPSRRAHLLPCAPAPPPPRSPIPYARAAQSPIACTLGCAPARRRGRAAAVPRLPVRTLCVAADARRRIVLGVISGPSNSTSAASGVASVRALLEHVGGLHRAGGARALTRPRPSATS